MNGDLSIPPLRDLPPGRLAQRREHLLLEVTRERASRDALSRPWLSRWGTPSRRRLSALVAAALVVAVGTASAIGGVRAFILDRGFVGLPPVGATPTAPESGELVVQWFGFTAPLSPQRHGRDIVRAWVYADGRIIWDRRPHGPAPDSAIPEGANEVNSGYLEQRLTSQGVELVRAAVAELFDGSRTLVDTIPVLEDPWWGDTDFRFALFVPNDYASDWGVVAVRDGDRLARLRWNAIEAKKFLDLEGALATSEQLSALRRVEALLTDPVSVLPSSAWAVRNVRAYVPSHYAVCIDTSPPKDASQLLSLLPAQAADLLRDKSRTRSEGSVVASPEGGGTVVQSVTDCYKLTIEEAREAAEALSGLDPDPRWGTKFGLAYRVAEGNNWWERTAVSFEPYFPDGRLPLSAPSG